MLVLGLLFPLFATVGTFVWASLVPRVVDHPRLGYGELATFLRLLAAIAFSISFWAIWYSVLAS